MASVSTRYLAALFPEKQKEVQSGPRASAKYCGSAVPKIEGGLKDGAKMTWSAHIS